MLSLILRLVARSTLLLIFLAPPQHSQASPQSSAVWTRGTSQAGHFRVAWRTIPEHIQLGRLFEIKFRIEDRDGAPLGESLRVFPDAAMPLHGHGMTRRPLATRLDDGSFHAKGLLFHMAGDWLLIFDIQDGTVFDRATFPIKLEPKRSSASAPEGMTDELFEAILQLSPLPSIPVDLSNEVADDQGAANLGQYLFYDKRLSKDASVACSSCHLPAKDWTDGKAFSNVRAPLERNTPSLWNVAFNRWFFWDGRSDSLWSQALRPLEEEREHAGNRLSFAHLIASTPELKGAYESIFGPLPDISNRIRFPDQGKPDNGSQDTPMGRAWESMAAGDQAIINRIFSNIGKCIAAFERLLISEDSPFDRFVLNLRTGKQGRTEGFGIPEERGLELFLGKAGCHNCHSGPNFTDNEFHNTRLPNHGKKHRDAGRFQGLQEVLRDPFGRRGDFSDGSKMRAHDLLDPLIVSGESFAEFKTPSLRNVGGTAPYMHDGRFKTLEEVVQFYSDDVSTPNIHAHQERVLRPASLSPMEKKDLLNFLRALGDSKFPSAYGTQPDLIE